MLDVEKVADALLEHVRRLIAPLAAKIADLEARKPEKGEAGIPGSTGPQGEPGRDGKQGDPGRDGRDGLPGRDGTAGIPGSTGPQGEPGRDGKQGDPGRDGRDGLPGRDGTNGLDGKPGEPGQNGKDGRDGLDLEDMTEHYEDDGRTLVRRWTRGGVVIKEFRHTTSQMIYRGVFKEGETYGHGDTVTWGGSLYHCNEETNIKPGTGNKAWTLAAKRGNDGNNGRDGKSGERGPQGLPGRDRT